MKTLKFISVAAAALLVAASCSNQPALTVTNEDGSTRTVELPDKALTDSVSYLVGLNFGYFIKANNFGEDLNYNKIREGMMAFIKSEGNMNDPAFNDQFKIGPDKMNALFNSYLSARREYEAEANKQAGHKFLEANKQNAGVVVTESGLQYEILESGSGEEANPDSVVSAHYSLTLLDGRLADSSYERGEPTDLDLQSVIPGFREGVSLMRVGDRYRFWVPPELGYGETAHPGIEPNSLLIFDVSLLGID